MPSAKIIRTPLVDGEVLVDIRHLPFRGYDIELPITKLPDGRVCLSHVARMATDHEQVSVGLGQVCGPPAGDGKTPQNLLETREVGSMGVMVQLPVFQSPLPNGLVSCTAHVTLVEHYESASRIETENHCTAALTSQEDPVAVLAAVH